MAHKDEQRIVDNEEVSKAEKSGGRQDYELALPSSRSYRSLALIFLCLLGYGAYFCYDNPTLLQELRDNLDLNNSQFTLIYSIYSWPNTVFCFLGGFLIDRLFGIRLGTIIYMLILLVGQLIFASGGILDTFWLMILGRFIFGIGAESLVVAQNKYSVLWFKGKELSMVFGMQQTMARLAIKENSRVMQPIYGFVSNFLRGHRALGVVLLLAALTCVGSLLCALILGHMDKRAERILQRSHSPSGQIPKLTDVFTFKPPFWMVSIICVAYYGAIFLFIALGQRFFMDRFHYTPTEANNVDSLVYLIAAVSSPVFGFIIDKLGRNVTWVFSATTTTIGAHLLLTFTDLNPYIGMTIMGLSYSLLAASLWPLVALIIPEYQLGTAYGFCQSVQNLGLAVITILAGIIADKSNNDHTWVQLFFIGWLTVALIATCVIWGYDKKQRGNLNMTPAQRINFVNSATYQNFE
ncbi:major facilitator superfamily domain-containing protein 1 isoform X2 [Drosophila innubila]|uniref:major facilitator superfamily domain-containing protein 1 isoform X2 n=1 Tax=Drosophila innubila TaxID=198719 RepID=UPI00148B62CE|nr:major facilitator superfamily domain-containing protein 1 isoform X2 [Drosophila innubila]